MSALAHFADSSRTSPEVREELAGGVQDVGDKLNTLFTFDLLYTIFLYHKRLSTATRILTRPRFEPGIGEELGCPQTAGLLVRRAPVTQTDLDDLGAGRHLWNAND
jgi:hypothetical protein